MGIDVAAPLRLKWAARKPFLADGIAKPQQRLSANALLGMGLWTLLWLGYNTDLGYLATPDFPANGVILIHGVRAFFPMLAGWIALLLIFARSSRLFSWIIGPLGLMLFYAFTGLISSATMSVDPTDALYFGFNYLAIVLALLAIVLVEDPLPDIHRVLKVTWGVGTILTLSLLGAIPFLGSAAMRQSGTSPVGAIAYYKVSGVLGMAGTRNTGFARYAAVSGLVALAGLFRKGKPQARIIWGILLAVSLYALVIANGRTETVGFFAGVAVIVCLERAQRTVSILVGIAAGLLLGLWGFHSAFYTYFTRGHGFDPTMTGRTRTWEEGWHLLANSPWVGYGFQADRYLLRFHMHNAFLHVFIQSGFLGGASILLGLAIVWRYLIKYFFLQPPADKSLVPPEIPAVFIFVTISSIMESTFAYFSAAWLLSAPIVAYAIALNRHVRKATLKASQDRALRALLANRKPKAVDPLPPPQPPEEVPLRPRKWRSSLNASPHQ